MLASTPAQTLNPIRSRRGIPRFSLFGKCSKSRRDVRRSVSNLAPRQHAEAQIGAGAMIAIAGPTGRRRPFPLLGLQSGQVDAESQLAIADAGKGLRLRAEIEPIVQPPAISDARRITGGDRR